MLNAGIKIYGGSCRFFCPWNFAEEEQLANRKFPHIARIISILEFYEKTLKLFLKGLFQEECKYTYNTFKMFRSSQFFNLLFACSNWEDFNMKSENLSMFAS